MGRVAEFFEKRGVAPSDIPKGLLMLKACSYSVWMAGLVTCYKFQPLLRILPQSTKVRLAQAQARLGQRLHSRVHLKGRRDRIKAERQNVFQRRADALKSRHGWAQRFADYVETKADHFAEKPTVRKVASYFKLNAKRFALAVAESFVLYKVTLPIHLPIQVWFVINRFKNKEVKGQSVGDVYGDQSEYDDAENPQPMLPRLPQDQLPESAMPAVVATEPSSKPAGKLKKQKVNRSILPPEEPEDDIWQRYLQYSANNSNQTPSRA